MFDKNTSQKRDRYLDLLARSRSEIHKVIISMDELIDCMFVCLFAPPRQPGEPYGAHLLIEGSHGKGKSKLVEVMAKCVDLRFERFQGDNEKQPTDITGFECRDPNDTTCTIFEKGPVFSDLVLADEINRINPKCQSAFLQPMEERRVIINGTEHTLSEFLRVFATINPTEEQGTSTWDLPVAQKDRFIINYLVTQLAESDELKIARGQTRPMDEVERGILGQEDIRKIGQFVAANYGNDDLTVTINRIARQTNDHELIMVGASPRAGSDIRRLSQCLAFMSGEDQVLPEHIVRASMLAMRERIILEDEFDMNSEEIILDVLGKITMDGE